MVNQLETNGVGNFHKQEKTMEKHWGKETQLGISRFFVFVCKGIAWIKNFMKNTRKSTSGEIYIKLKSLLSGD